MILYKGRSTARQKNKKALRTEKINVVCVDYCFIPEMLLFFAVRVLSMCDRMLTKKQPILNKDICPKHALKVEIKSFNSIKQQIHY